jgi:hypothetical protein
MQTSARTPATGGIVYTCNQTVMQQLSSFRFRIQSTGCAFRPTFATVAAFYYFRARLPGCGLAHLGLPRPSSLYTRASATVWVAGQTTGTAFRRVVNRQEIF